MDNEPRRVVFRLGRDPHLLFAVSCGVRFQAGQAGLDEQGCKAFAQASEEVCREALLQLAGEDHSLEITLDTFADRIEVSIHHHGQQVPPVGLEAFAVPGAVGSRPGGLSGVELLERVDRVLFNTEEGVARTTLVKYLRRGR